MWSFKNIIISVIFIIIAGLLIWVSMPYKDSFDPYNTYITTVANVIVILLMLVTIVLTESSAKEHITSVEQATRKQIESWEHWEQIKRKQSLNALIKETKKNLEILKYISAINNTNSTFINLILINIERSLHEPPTDDETINQKVLELYLEFRIIDNKISSTRIPGITQNMLVMLVETLKLDYDINKEGIETVIELLEKYYEKIQ